VQSVILGVVGEYVGRTFLSANGKPQGTVRLVRGNVPPPERT
jgi:undecaprenyl-phosphate 4-deoxy-4-formamido-L-arabinose transferase